MVNDVSHWEISNTTDNHGTHSNLGLDTAPKLETAVYTVEEVAQLLRIGRSSAYEAVRRGQIPALRLGRRLRVPRSALEQLLRGHLSDQSKEDLSSHPNYVSVRSI